MTLFKGLTQSPFKLIGIFTLTLMGSGSSPENLILQCTEYCQLTTGFKGAEVPQHFTEGAQQPAGLVLKYSPFEHVFDFTGTRIMMLVTFQYQRAFEKAVKCFHLRWVREKETHTQPKMFLQQAELFPLVKQCHRRGNSFSPGLHNILEHKLILLDCLKTHSPHQSQFSGLKSDPLHKSLGTCWKGF